MNIGLKVLIILVFGMTLIMCMSDILVNNKMEEDHFSTLRTANENALSLIKDEDEISDIEMLNNWLYCFLEDNNMDYEELKINFISLGSNPPHYYVYIEGSNKYMLISKDVHSAFKNAAGIVQKEVE